MWNMCTNREIFSTLWKRKKDAILSVRTVPEQWIIDNAAERGSRRCGIWAGMRMFQDWWLGQRGAGLGGDGGCI
jgi:hypothetical protein